jgi:hypothetical protein
MILHVSSGLSLTMFSTVYYITHWEKYLKYLLFMMLFKILNHHTNMTNRK